LRQLWVLGGDSVENFTPLSALAGGALIGLGAAVLLLGAGRIAGISGILGGMLQWSGGDRLWRAAFVVGLIVGAGAYALAAPDQFVVHFDATAGTVAAAGLIVGYGTRLGHGCTSGHGVCGIARLSPRGLAATALFMAAAMLTVYVTRHVLVEP
jgi:uncharacterized membrane protein YedE/YeeE